MTHEHILHGIRGQMDCIWVSRSATSSSEIAYAYVVRSVPHSCGAVVWSGLGWAGHYTVRRFSAFNHSMCTGARGELPVCNSQTVIRFSLLTVHCTAIHMTVRYGL
jgi:hypothetical protein